MRPGLLRGIVFGLLFEAAILVLLVALAVFFDHLGLLRGPY